MRGGVEKEVVGDCDCCKWSVWKVRVSVDCWYWLKEANNQK